jgi:exopolyphosphatase/pppGpp-phosphohydrolase
MGKITKQKQKEFLRTKLGSNPKWALRGLMVIYNYQTEDEKVSETIREYNNVGFTGVDRNILTSFANQYMRRRFLSEKQMELLFKKMPKYWKQLLAVSDENILNSQILNTQ